MSGNRAHWGLLITFAITLVGMAVGCGRKEPEPPAIFKGTFGQTVRGKVTYEGEKVPYGVVLFYNDLKVGKKSDNAVPMASALITDGQYEATNVPSGIAHICVAADPDVMPESLKTPTKAGGGGGKEKKGKGAPRRPIIKDKDDKEEGDPDESQPKAMTKKRKGIVNPFTEKMTDQQKDVLREIHERYGTLFRSPIMFAVREGEQNFNIELKRDDGMPVQKDAPDP